MKTWQQLAQDADALFKRAQEILVGKKDADGKDVELTDEEMTKATGLTSEAEKLMARSAMLRKVDETRADLDRSEQDPPRAAIISPHGVDEPPLFRTRGEQLGAIIRAGQTNNREVDPRLLNVHKRATGHSESVDSEGGYLLEEKKDDKLYENAWNESGMLNKTTVIPLTGAETSFTWNAIEESSRAVGSQYGGLRVYRMKEGGTLTASTTKLDKKRLELHKMGAYTVLTQEQVNDTPALGRWLDQTFPKAFAWKIDNELMNGSGAGEMLGVLNHSDGLVNVAKETDQAAKTIVPMNIFKMFSRMLPSSMKRAEWYINQDIYPELFSLSLPVGAAGGQLVFVPPTGIAGTPYGTLLGKPVNVIEQCKTLGTKGDICLIDWSSVIVITKGDMRADTSMHVLFASDEMALKFIMYNNGQPLLPKVITPANGTATIGPLVTLAARA